MSAWQLTVGLEVHVELETATKMFCGCKNDPFNAPPNTQVFPVCYGLPGALPLLNRRAIEMTVQLGQALNGQIATKSFWARKNYFYPDLPKGYQISQSSAPLISRATLMIDGAPHRIERIHLEEDAGKLTHTDQGHSLVNYNRAGVPLIEIVTAPDFHSAESAKHFCQELQRVMRHLKISKADMEKGQMRCEANISIARPDEELGTKVEVKNLNSFRSVERAIKYEFERQVKALEANEKLTQETRLWDEKGNRTAPMRTKETSADYRYFPEPDLRTILVEAGTTDRSLVLPDEQRDKLRRLGFSDGIAKILVDRNEYDSIMETYTAATARYKKDDQVKHYIVEDGKLRIGVPEFAKLQPADRLDLLAAREAQGWAKTAVEEIVKEMLGGKTLAELSRRTEVNIEEVARQVIKENETAVGDYRSGKPAALNFLVGQVMAKTKGQVNVAQARETLVSLLD